MAASRATGFELALLARTGRSASRISFRKTASQIIQTAVQTPVMNQYTRHVRHPG
jgi:hypothetical protein